MAGRLFHEQGFAGRPRRMSYALYLNAQVFTTR
jgi:hypothetical protein